MARITQRLEPRIEAVEHKHTTNSTPLARMAGEHGKKVPEQVDDGHGRDHFSASSNQVAARAAEPSLSSQPEIPPRIPTILRGDPQMLSALCSAAVRDIKAYVVDEKDIVGGSKQGHGWNQPAGTSFVLMFCLEDCKEERSGDHTGNIWAYCADEDEEQEAPIHFVSDRLADLSTSVQAREEALDSKSASDSAEEDLAIGGIKNQDGELDAADQQVTKTATSSSAIDPHQSGCSSDQHGTMARAIVNKVEDTSEIQGTELLSNAIILDTAESRKLITDEDMDAEAARRARLLRSHKVVSLAALIAAANRDEPLVEDAADAGDIKPSPNTSETIAAPTPPTTSPDNDTSPEAAHSPCLQQSRPILSQTLHPNSTSSPMTMTLLSESPSPSPAATPSSLAMRHAPCAKHITRKYGHSCNAAIHMLRDHFEARHSSTGHVGWYQAWCEVKPNGSGDMVHGGSRLRYEVTGEDEDRNVLTWLEGTETSSKYAVDDPNWDDSELVVSNSPLPTPTVDDVSSHFDEHAASLTTLQRSSSPFDDTVGLPDEHLGHEDATIAESSCSQVDDRDIHLNTPSPAPRISNIRDARAADEMSENTSPCTSVFTRKSVTTNSSRESHGMTEVRHSPVLDAFDLDLDLYFEANKGKAGQPIISSPRESKNIAVGHDSHLECSSPNITMESSAESAVDNDPLPQNSAGHHYPAETLRTSSRKHRWTKKCLHPVREFPDKLRQARHSMGTTTKRFTRTLVGFVPVALAGRNTFQGV
ncbi:hypothetical protein EK21DRAFT_89576 [Setomelanomma holmii]|uniref:Uncharacterized protein n=1 Tax=Setomelanomma holmii TaxID=210430 RepID=A0A9P4H7N7_9PLEO|nr:hypothetical protein EK21DRAFT_89576 [Setomelanomma holmii]